MLSAQGFVAGQDDPVHITVLRGGVSIDYANDPIFQELEREANVDISFVTMPWGDIPQVKNLALASGEDIDIYMHMDTNPQWINEGAIIPLEDYINPVDHPYLSSLISSPLFESAKVDGHDYYLPMVVDGWDWVLKVRQDWMNELGLDMPTNEVEFRDMLQAFKDRDPEGRTVGMQVEGGQTIRRSMWPILTLFGVPSNFPNPHKVFWIGDDGKLVSIMTSENVKAALQYMNGLYNAGLINTDFPSVPSFPALSETYWQAGKAGVAWLTDNGQFDIPDPEAETANIPPFSATGFEHTRAQGLATAGWISVSSVSDNPQKAVDLLEFLNSRQGRLLLNFGIEGVNYRSIDAAGNVDRDEEAWPYDSLYYPLNFYFGQGAVRGYVPVEKYDTFADALDHVEIWQPTNAGHLRESLQAGALWSGAPMPFQYIELPELNDINVALTDASVTGWTKAITAAPENFEREWDAYVAAWDAGGGQEWTQAFQTYYDEHMAQ